VRGDLNFPALESLSLATQNPPLNLEQFKLAPLGTLPRLEHLDLHGNQLVGVVQPGEVLVGLFPALMSLDMSQNAIELEIALAPCAALAQSSLEEISVCGNEVAEVMLMAATGAAGKGPGTESSSLVSSGTV